MAKNKFKCDACGKKFDYKDRLIITNPRKDWAEDVCPNCYSEEIIHTEDIES